MVDSPRTGRTTGPGGRNVPNGAPRRSGRPRGPSAQQQNHDRPRRRWVRWAIIGGVAAAVIVGLVIGVPWLIEYFHTVSTDDAYVNGHVSMIRARVGGQVTTVRVDDNDRVHQGDLLMRTRPPAVPGGAVNQKKAALETAEANLNAATAQARGQEAAARARWYSLVSARSRCDPDRHCAPTSPTSGSSRPTSTWRRRPTASADWSPRTRPPARRSSTSASPPRRSPGSTIADAQETIRKTRAATRLPPNGKTNRGPRKPRPEFLGRPNRPVQRGPVSGPDRRAAAAQPLDAGRTVRDLTSRGASSDLNQTLDQLVPRRPQGVAKAPAARTTRPRKTSAMPS